jgi:protein involved in polysaccharide export with SLBB domain
VNRRHILRWTLAAALAATAGADASAQNQPPPRAAPDTGAVLRPGDQLRITVWRKPEYSGDFLVGGNGALRHPLFQNVSITGVPLASVRTRLEGVLKQYEENPAFVLEPLLRVAVTGEVRTPNLYAFTPEVTVAQAIALAGGVTERGRLSQVQLLRGGGRTRVDLTRPESRGALMTVRSGDQITVTRSRNILTEIILPTSSLVAAVGTIIQLYRNR